jgi:hypothetical protein
MKPVLRSERVTMMRWRPLWLRRVRTKSLPLNAAPPVVT